ncbi:MAG: arsenate reductase (glutaredoxin) [Flavobacterium sp.]|uniref:arsenate reductase (glutaredoxin) n=1 Tax=Flavobacterium sp. TaxID=239 RepID=UPI0011F97D6A|nr:arsenate reductase (glutaredoxin) [Flavobacterium sp.]RZJ66632.1 MAG: arsenate reductase (glutaredoxin) [Flavobacterium sp.]
MIQVYHNPRCGKSRECLAFLDDEKVGYEIVEYLKTKPKFREIQSLLKKLRVKAIEIVRTKEPEWQPFKNETLTNDEIIHILVKHPILIERPIVVKGDKAVVARPLEKAAEVIRS